ncbi:superoxide dismutase family protein [Scytonema sp. UIC 10036]|uniref:superoxide dismutase family protein n=1 Tax=Scytonema sp. UIC 10036 TaxID=2304196 RepID=UPI0012DA1F88|nr:superoxide dismutase family protein [Scytonema sp. UIC 10036]MUG94268.1 superoxide dismutase family protein [Scytonema sp. UIC 10036]
MKIKLPIKYLFVLGVTLGLIIVSQLVVTQTSVAWTLPVAQTYIEGTNITGTLFFIERKDGSVQIKGEIQGDPAVLTPGLHGLHIHSAGTCDLNAQPAFSTSGGHFDPGPFGSELPVEANHPYHLGDLPNLVVDENGYAKYNVVTSRVTLRESPVSVFDDNGSAIIIHQLQDLQQAGAQAAQAGGGRIACGVITFNT